MKTLNNAEILSVSGGVICFYDECIKVRSDGIPSQHFKSIESNLQLFLDGKISEDQMYTNLINAKSFNYLHIYFENLFEDHPYLLS